MEQFLQKPRSWPQKFRDALRGILVGVRGQSFVVHAVCATGVVAVAAVTNMVAWQWCALLLCVTTVMVAELFNTALEAIAKAVSTDFHPQLRDALDIASGAVLMAAVGAVVVGSVVLATVIL